MPRSTVFLTILSMSSAPVCSVFHFFVAVGIQTRLSDFEPSLILKKMTKVCTKKKLTCYELKVPKYKVLFSTDKLV